MKKLRHFVSIATIASLALVGCSQVDDFTANSDLTNNESNAVQFGTYMGRAKETRAYSSGPITNDATGENSLKTAQFGVFSYLTTDDYNNTTPTSLAPNFMYNQQITWDGTNSVWTYTPVKYWPNGTDVTNQANTPSNTAGEVTSGGKLSFFAFAPYTTATGTYTYSVTTDTKPTVLGGAATTNDGKIKKNDNTKGVVAMTTNDWNGNVWVKYILGTDANSASETNFVDLLWGTRGTTNYEKSGSSTNDAATIGADYNINLTKQTVDERVKFLFKHALAKIGGATAKSTGKTVTGDPEKCGFKVVVDVDANNADKQTSYFPAGFNNAQTLVTIKEVKIQDGYTAGQDATITTVENTTKSNLNTYGWFNIETGAWCNETNTYGKVGDSGARYEVVANNDATLENTVYRLNEKVLEIGAGKFGAGGVKELNATGDEWSTAVPTGVTTTAQNLFANEDVPALMVIPGGSADLYITVDYFVRTADPALRDGFTSVEQVITNKVSLGSLDPNKYYTIIMHLGLTSVKFEAVVSDWQTKSDSSIGEDGKETGGTDENTYKETVWLPSNVVAKTVAVDAVATAGNTAVNLTGLQGTTLTVVDSDPQVVTGATGLDITTGSATVQVACTANTGTQNREGWIKLSDGYQTITINVTQAAGALTVSGTGANTGVTSFSVTDAASNSLTIKKSMISIVDESSAAVVFTTDNDENVSSITFGTALTSGKTYTITVTYNDATGTKVVSHL